MAVGDSIAQDHLRAFIERIERMEEEKAAISSDIKEIYAEAKGKGFDTKILRKLVGIRKQDANERLEQEALLELYMSALGMVAAPPSYSEERERLNSIASIVRADLQKPKADPLAALRADPAMAIVDVGNLKSQPSPTAEQAGLNKGQATPSPVESEAAEISTPIQPETANDCQQPPETDQRLSVAGPKDTAGRQSADTLRAERGRPGDGVTAGETAPKYAAPGVITWETFPPEGVERGAISAAFGWAGQDSAVIADDLEKGRAQPIVKKGNVILDGWARYMAARDMRNLDGSPVAYPVVQYDGTDLLVDIIKLNVDGRILTDDQKRKIAANLARQEPSRKDDIYKAFELWMEPL